MGVAMRPNGTSCPASRPCGVTTLHVHQYLIGQQGEANDPAPGKMRNLPGWMRRQHRQWPWRHRRPCWCSWTAPGTPGSLRRQPRRMPGRLRRLRHHTPAGRRRQRRRMPAGRWQMRCRKHLKLPWKLRLQPARNMLHELSGFIFVACSRCCQAQCRAVAYTGAFQQL